MGQDRLEGDRHAPTLRAEEVSMERQRVETGGITPQVRTICHDHLVDDAPARERVEIERVAVGRLVDAAWPSRWEGDTTVIPGVEEVVVVERRLVLKEEVCLGRVRAARHHHGAVSLRTQQASVYGLPVEAAEADLPAAAPAVMQPPTRNPDK